MDRELIEQELVYKAVRSGGPGGQHVNKVSSKVQLSFDVRDARGLSEKEKALVFKKLSNHINKKGVLQLSADNKRSQLQNRLLVAKRFFRLIKAALTIEEKRKATKPSKAAIEKRLIEKKRASEKKSNRGKPDRNS